MIVISYIFKNYYAFVPIINFIRQQGHLRDYPKQTHFSRLERDIRRCVEFF